MLDAVPGLIEKTFPLPAKFRKTLGADVAELSRLLTGGRGERSLSYLGHPALLSAYLRFFLPWNLYRLCLILPGLDLRLTDNDRITDLGSGPLTLASALWIARPELRELALEFFCLDRSGPALDAGKLFFAALGGSSCPWKIKTVKADISGRSGLQRGDRKGKASALVCAVNVLNEIYGNIPHNDTGGLKRCAEKSARLLALFAAPSASLLVVEPGVPRSGQFISLLRDAFLEQNRPPLAPCPHSGPCPCAGGLSRAGKNRWCHFAFDTAGAPKALHSLSAAAGLPKERAALSFLLAGPADTRPAPENPAFAPADKTLSLRVISDPFPLPPARFGRYCCSARGLVLLRGEKTAIEKTAPAALVQAAPAAGEARDPKSGALVAELL
jgi:hypothetical protein